MNTTTDTAREDRERAARARWAARRRRLLAYGRWHPWVDPEPTRQHIAELRRYGLSHEVIAMLAGEQPYRLSTLVQPGNADYLTKIRPARAAAICAVRFDLDAIPDGHRVHAAGTQRRLEALAYMGWSLSYVARRLGLSVQAVAQHRRRPQVHAETARAVRDLYEELWDKPGPCGRTRAWARREGLQPPLAWDDIDDPDSTPDGRSDSSASAGRVDAQEVEHLASFGLDADTIGHRLGVAPGAVERSLYRHGRFELLEQLRRNRGAQPSTSTTNRAERAS